MMKLLYDRENDILSVHKGFSNGEKFKGNIEIGDLVLDLSTKMRIRGIEILNASQYLKEFLSSAKTKNAMEHIRNIEFTVITKGNSMILSLTIVLEMEKKKEKIPAKIAIPFSTDILS